MSNNPELDLLYATLPLREFALVVLPEPFRDLIILYPASLDVAFLADHVARVRQLAEESPELSAQLRKHREEIWESTTGVREAFAAALYAT